MVPEKRKPRGGRTPASGRLKPVGLRIIGGTFRGRKLQYGADRRVRPMKDRVREAIFNLLGPSVRGKHAIDLFAGTGALGLEAVSRGASGATFIECHYPTARVLEANVATLAVESVCRVVVADTFAWIERERALPAEPWIAFLSPPYEFFIQRAEAMLRLIGSVYAKAPAESLLVVESDQRFDCAGLPDAPSWDIRSYPPARVAIVQKPVLSNPQIPESLDS